MKYKVGDVIICKLHNLRPLMTDYFEVTIIEVKSEMYMCSYFFCDKPEKVIPEWHTSERYLDTFKPMLKSKLAKLL